MSKISNYILKAHIGPFLFGSTTVMFLFLFQFIMKTLDSIVGKGLDTWVIVQLIALSLAWMVVLAVPMGVLFATLMTFGGMAASHEVTIIKASGGSLLKMMYPVIIWGAILSYMLFWFNDKVLPEANHRYKVLMNDINRKKPTFSIEAGQFSTQLDGYTILSRSIDSSSGLLKGVTIYDNTKPQRLNIASADSGIIEFSTDYSRLIINLINGEIHQSTPLELKNYRRIKFQRYKLMAGANGFTFERSSENSISRGDREMKIADMQLIVDESLNKSKESEKRLNNEMLKDLDFCLGLVPKKPQEINSIPAIEPPRESNFLDVIARVKKHKIEKKETIVSKEVHFTDVDFKNQAIQRLQFLKTNISTDLFQRNDLNLRAEQYKVEIYKKYAIPFACFIFVLVGCPLGIMTKGGNFGLSAAISLGFYIFYWACLIAGEKFADRGIISSFMSMWMGNIFIGIIGILLTLRTNFESLKFTSILSGFLHKSKYKS